MKWKVDYNALIPFLGKTIYRPENVLVELGANSYDADATRVEFMTKGDSQQILIRDDGCGMDLDDLNDLVTVGKSKKKEMIENNKTTKKFNRKLLGSFGIGIISFFALGDFIKIFTKKKDCKALHIEIRKVYNKDNKLIDITITEPKELEDYTHHLIDREQGTTIEINNNKLMLKDKRQYEIIKHKLSNLPLNENFKVKFNDVEIKKDDYPENDWFKSNFDFVLDNYDSEYKSNCEVYVNTKNTIEDYKRGLYLVVNGRVIEKDLFAEIFPSLTSPGTIQARNRGFIFADYLSKSIQANREDFFDSDIIDAIKDKIRKPIDGIIEGYKNAKNTEEKDVKFNELLQRIKRAENKYAAVNDDLDRLNINFKNNPEYEQELVLIIAQLCQKGLLPFQILDYNSNSHIDCIVKWPMQQEKRFPNFISELEVEMTLDNFFKHNHDFRTRPDICCWEVKEANFEREKVKYIKNRNESIYNIELKEPKNSEHFGHQKEIHFSLNKEHNIMEVYILRVYVISSIIKSLDLKNE